MSEIRTSALHQIQDEFVLRLKADTALSTIDIFTEKTKDIETEIENSLGSLKGICIIVLTPRMRATKANVPGPMFDDTTVIGRVIENVTINNSDRGTKLPALYVAELIAGAWHRWVKTDGRSVSINEIVLVPDEVNLMYDVIGKTITGLQPRSIA